MTTRPGAGSLLVRGGKVLGLDGWRSGDVLIHQGRIVATPVAPAPPGPAGVATLDGAATLEGVATLDATGLLVAPGLVDLQCNGAGGIDLTTEPERVWEVAALLPRWGVTAWLPTIVTAPANVRRRALETLAAGPGGPEPRRARPAPNAMSARPEVVAEPLGLHIEGPFLSPEHRGAHRVEQLRMPDRSLVETEDWCRDDGVALVTLAPELPGALDLIRALVDRGVVVSLGHSAATADQATAAVDAGASWVTHLFNGMAPLHHREPGLAGVALTDERLRVGVIADGIHLHPTTVALVARTLGPRLTLVTDAMAALGAPPGPSWLGEAEVFVDGGEVRLPDGTLAGSTLSLDQAVKNLAAWTGSGTEVALRAASEVPAEVLGLAGERGVVSPGATGDLALFDPGAGSGGLPTLVATVVGGTVAFPLKGRDRAENR